MDRIQLPFAPAVRRMTAARLAGHRRRDERGVPAHGSARGASPQGPHCDIGAFERGFLLYLPLVLRSP
ncbi:MAG: hypothetical protein NZM16_02585 [Thermoflexus sp.]|nr:hypothetical protein [Thermoflexus sp.]MDW8180308.1 hypothetical protein [Anaerolineae bacterium]MCS6962919.1 hypothetical protein [Thermoflexus sp.]MCS7350857.1 hypothetical protein [Thermoflexus sp.]MCX7690247.1 hypothetical protein [Thermoflexus sp.]MDW8186192.1 hypothetical protein [Anaerolineae bacterium]